MSGMSWLEVSDPGYVVVPGANMVTPPNNGHDSLAELAAEIDEAIGTDVLTNSVISSQYVNGPTNEQLLSMDQTYSAANTSMTRSPQQEAQYEDWWRPVAIVHGKKSRLSTILSQPVSKRLCTELSPLDMSIQPSPSSIAPTQVSSMPMVTNQQLYLNDIASLDNQMAQLSPPATAERLVYALVAPTSAVIPRREETLTYLNQYQSYEIKLSKVTATPTKLRGLRLRSELSIGFQDRRLQYRKSELLSGSVDILVMIKSFKLIFNRMASFAH